MTLKQVHYMQCVISNKEKNFYNIIHQMKDGK